MTQLTLKLKIEVESFFVEFANDIDKLKRE